MNRMLRSLVVGAFTAVGAAGLTPACADDNASLFITSVLYRQPPQCVVTADPTAKALGGGVLDLAFTKSYEAALLVGNQLTARGSKQTLRAETSRVTLRGAEVIITDSQGAQLYKFSVNGTGFVDVNRGEDAGYGIFEAELIPAPIGGQLLARLNKLKGGSTSQQISDQVIAKVRVFGNTLGNEDVTSSELSFPITYCEGCLIDYPLVAAVADTNGALHCQKNLTDIPQGGCRLGQDDKIDCRSCSGMTDLCDRFPSTGVVDAGAP